MLREHLGMRRNARGEMCVQMSILEDEYVFKKEGRQFRSEKYDSYSTERVNNSVGEASQLFTQAWLMMYYSI
jgi:hypothetical protein